MASSERFSIYPATIVHAGGSLHLRQIENVQVNAAKSKTPVIPGGALDPAAHLLASADPGATLGTRDLLTLLTNVSLSAGLPLSGTSTLRFQEREDLGAFLTGSTHVTATVAAGFFHVASISAEQDSAEGALAECVLTALYNASVLPVVINDAQDITTTTPAFVSQYFLGPCYYNSSEIKGVLSTRIDTGLTFGTKRSSGQIYPTKGAITRRTPRLLVTIDKLDAAAAYNLFAQSLTNEFAVYLLKATDSGSARATGSNHIKISSSTVDATPDDINVAGDGDTTVTFEVMIRGTLSLSVASSVP